MFVKQILQEAVGMLGANTRRQRRGGEVAQVPRDHQVAVTRHGGSNHVPVIGVGKRQRVFFLDRRRHHRSWECPSHRSNPPCSSSRTDPFGKAAAGFLQDPLAP
jgi:hypothetical protein